MSFRNLITEEISLNSLKEAFVDDSKYQVRAMKTLMSFEDSLDLCFNIGGEHAIPGDNVNMQDFIKVMLFSTHSFFPILYLRL